MNAGEQTLPPPRPLAGKKTPRTKYTSKVYSHVHTASERHADVHLQDDSDGDEQEQHEETCINTDEGHRECYIDKFSDRDYEEAAKLMIKSNEDDLEDEDSSDDEEDDNDDHLPAGQHLLIDIERVNSDFLNSEVRLAEAMVKVVNTSQLTLLSYHCHKLVPMGVSCVGVLLESHISFHTWPEAGVITLDLFTCGSGELVPVLPIVKGLFAIPRDGVTEESGKWLKPHTKWTHKLRGFRGDVQHYLAGDLGDIVLESSDYEYKEHVASVQTPFQKVDIYDTISDANDMDMYEHSLANDGSYAARNRLLFEPNRLVFLDGVLQSTRDGIESYHEALVQPAMFAHSDPKRVAIIGGGEGATLHEVLKHNTVDTVKMVEIDELMVMTSKEHLKDWSACKDLQGSADWCGDDERAQMVYGDAFAWFNDRFFLKTKKVEEEPFDVLIMDALDPEDDIPFAAMLYNSYDFLKTLYNSLSVNGVIVLQLGEATDYSEPAAQFTKASRREQLINLLVDVGFEAMHLYEDGNCGFNSPWTFLVAFKNQKDDQNWYRNRAQIDIEIHERILRTKSGRPTLKYFDGALMQGYQNPHKVFESVFCRADPMPSSCETDHYRENVALSDFEVRMSEVGEGSGRGVYTKVDIKEGTSIAKKESVNAVHVPGSAMDLIHLYMKESTDMKKAYGYIDGYGWETHTFGGTEYFVESSILTFVNHGCNGTYNMMDWNEYNRWVNGDEDVIVTEMNATIDHYYDYHESVYDIYTDRHITHSALSYAVASRDIKAGEEITSNYVNYVSNFESWLLQAKDLKSICSGEDVGFITKAEADSLRAV